MMSSLCIGRISRLQHKKNGWASESEKSTTWKNIWNIFNNLKSFLCFFRSHWTENALKWHRRGKKETNLWLLHWKFYLQQKCHRQSARKLLINQMWKTKRSGREKAQQTTKTNKRTNNERFLCSPFPLAIDSTTEYSIAFHFKMKCVFIVRARTRVCVHCWWHKRREHSMGKIFIVVILAKYITETI